MAQKIHVSTLNHPDQGDLVLLSYGPKKLAFAKMEGGHLKDAKEIQRRYNAYDGMLMELRESLKDLEGWDGTPEAMEILKANIKDRIEKATR